MASQKLPRVHGEQDCCPTTAWKVPTGHAVHVTMMAPPDEYEPIWQLPVTAVKPWPPQYMPSLHDKHAPWPAKGWYEPRLHGLQVMAIALLAEDEPAWHSPVTADSPSCAQYLPGSQGVQKEVLAPEGEYDPAGHQPEVAVNPVRAQCFPGSQGLHDMLPGDGL